MLLLPSVPGLPPLLLAQLLLLLALLLLLPLARLLLLLAQLSELLSGLLLLLVEVSLLLTELPLPPRLSQRQFEPCWLAEALCLSLCGDDRTYSCAQKKPSACCSCL